MTNFLDPQASAGYEGADACERRRAERNEEVSPA
jgi:hypothetical protein